MIDSRYIIKKNRSELNPPRDFALTICRQLYRYNESRKPIEDYLKSFLQVLFHAAFAKGSLFMCIQDIFDDLDNEVGCFKNSKLSTKMVKELLQNLFVTNSFVEQAYNVSMKTAIGYLKQLEYMGFYYLQLMGEKRHI